MDTGTQIDPDLRDALEAALDACRQALGDYQAGLLDDAQLRHGLFRAGVVARPGDELWLLDLHGAQWWRYDGLGIGAHRSAMTDAGAARMRQVVDTLARELAAPAGGDR